MAAIWVPPWARMTSVSSPSARALSTSAAKALHTRSEKTAWERVLKDVHGAGPFEIDPAAPGWPAASSKAWPGYWELTLVSPGQRIEFRYAP